jgi:hypothetical protein
MSSGENRFYGIFRLVSKCDGGARKKTLIRRPKANKITRRNKLRLKWVLTPVWNTYAESS